MSVPLPDAFTRRNGDGYTIVAANKKARRVINKCFEGGHPPWRGIEDTPGNIIASPEYRAIEVEDGPVTLGMILALRDAGLTSRDWCDDCDRYHLINDERAAAIRDALLSCISAALQKHHTVQ